MSRFSKRNKNRLAFVVNVDWFFISHRLPLALHAIQKGWDVYLLAKDTGRKKELADMGISLIDIPFKRTSINPYHELKCLFTLRKELLRIKPAIIHNVTWKGCIWGSIAAEMVGIRHVVNALSGLGSAFVGNRFVYKILVVLAYKAFKKKECCLYPSKF